MPRTDPVVSLTALKAWIAAHGPSAVLKLDGRTGGEDLILLSDRANVAEVYLKLKLRQRGLRALWKGVARLDVEPLLIEWRDGRPAMSVQAFVAGRPANCAVACWRGEVLGFVAVEAVRTSSAFGVATVVRRIEGRAMRDAAEAIVRRLGLSGMCGFDFMIDDRSGEAMLIEINPRATQINHFPIGPEADLATALLGALVGRPPDLRPFSTVPDTPIVLFPHGRRDSENFAQDGVFHDAPYEEPELLKHFGYVQPAVGDLGAGPSRFASSYALSSANPPTE